MGVFIRGLLMVLEALKEDNVVGSLLEVLVMVFEYDNFFSPRYVCNRTSVCRTP